MSYQLTTVEAARRLGTSRPTVRALIKSETLRARKKPRGSDFQWLIDDESVDEYLATHGRYDDRSQPARPSLKTLDTRLSLLEDEVVRRSEPSIVASGSGATRQLDDARARIVDLEEALARSHTSAELLRSADEARAEIIEHLAAVSAAERADGLRRSRAYVELDEAVQGFSRAGYAGDLKD